MRVSTLFVASFVISLAVCEISFEMNLEGKRREAKGVWLCYAALQEREREREIMSNR